MKYYLKSLSMHFKTDMEYKKSFIMAFIAQIFVLFSNYFIIIALFSKFNIGDPDEPSAVQQE